MSNDLVFGVHITADGKQLIGEVDASSNAITRMGNAARDSADKVNQSASKMASQYTGLNATVKEHSAAVTDTAGNVTRLLDRYDPLGAKLRQLQSDFKALDAAASSGKIAGRDDARVDQVYVRLQQQITAASSATAAFDGTSQAAARSAGQLRMATQQLPMQFTDIFTSLAAGQNPMMVMMQQGGQIKDSFGGVGNAAQAMGGYILGMINPITLTAAAVTTIGAVAWESYGSSISQVREELNKLDNSLGLKTTAQLNKRYEEIEKQIDDKRAEASSGGFGWNKEAAEVKVYEEQLRKVGQQIDANKRFEEKQGNAGGQASKLAAESPAAKRRETEQQIALLQIYHDNEKTGDQAKIDSLSKIKELQKSLNPAVQKTAADQIRQQEQQVLQSLQKQAAGYQQLSEVEQTRWEIANGSYRKFSDQSKQELLLLAQSADAKAAQTKASKESASAQDESAKHIDKVNTASKEYVNQMQFENSLLGLSTLEVQKRTEARKIDLALEKELLALRNHDKYKARDSNPAVNAAYQADVKATQDAAEAARKGAEIEIDARDRVTKSWEFGSKEAIRKYDEQVRNSAAQAESLYGKAFKSAEDAVTHFMMTGKADIKSFANAVIEEFYRIKVAQPMVSAGANMLSGLFDGMFGGSPAGASASTVANFGPSPAAAGTTDFMSMLTGQRATGGPVDSNSLYRVNEKGPELLNYGGEDYLMMGGRGGYVKPLSAPASGAPASASSAPQSFKVEIINQGSTQMQVTRAEPSFDAAGMVVRLFLSDVQDGGPMSRAVGGAFGLRRQAV